jgi:hypothetical protein
MKRVEEGEEATVPQNTKSIAVAVFFFAQGELGRGGGEKFRVAPLGNSFLVENVGTVLGLKMH